MEDRLPAMYLGTAIGYIILGFCRAYSKASIAAGIRSLRLKCKGSNETSSDLAYHYRPAEVLWTGVAAIWLLLELIAINCNLPVIVDAFVIAI